MNVDLNTNYQKTMDKKFDLIIFADILEHTIHPEKILEYYSTNLLKQKGKIIISVPNIANWNIRLKLLFGKFDYTKTGILDETHLKFFTYNSIKKIIPNNCKIRKELYGASMLGHIIKIISFLRNLLATNIILIVKKK